MEARLKKNQDTFIGFVDLEKAFDNVKWCKMFEILRKIGISYKERRVIHSMYKNQEGIIRVGEQEISARIKKGVRQGCSLSSLLFNIYIEQAIMEIKERFEVVTMGTYECKIPRIGRHIVLLGYCHLSFVIVC